nr:MerR family transcriptional regulator [Bacteroidota bacterium]
PYMGPYLMRFQIRDLEEFSGVRAHTIRIWEKRYGLLEPERTGTNIRTYGINELKVILNVAFLNQRGHKISKIAALNAEQRDRLVREVALGDEHGGDALNSLKLAMLSFDEVLFESVSSKFREANGFRKLVEQLFVPLLEHIGLLWQTNSICPAHEHFVSNIIRHKLIVASDALPLNAAMHERIHILYLPENEIHELGLLYVNYLLKARGERTIYLGQSVPYHDLQQVTIHFPQKLVLIGILTTTATSTEIPQMLQDLREELPDERIQFWFAGNQMNKIPATQIPPGMKLFQTLAELIKEVEG